MVDPVNPGIQGIGPKPVGPNGRAGQSAPGGKSFREVFKEQMKLVNLDIINAEKAKEDLASGKTDNIDQVFAQVKKAELNFQTLMQIRNKLMDAYEQISTMRV